MKLSIFLVTLQVRLGRPQKCRNIEIHFTFRDVLILQMRKVLTEVGRLIATAAADCKPRNCLAIYPRSRDTEFFPVFVSPVAAGYVGLGFPFQPKQGHQTRNANTVCCSLSGRKAGCRCSIQVNRAGGWATMPRLFCQSTDSQWLTKADDSQGWRGLKFHGVHLEPFFCTRG